MGEIYLVRHGQASFGGPDYDVLSERGHEQARATADLLVERGVRPVRVVSGGLARQIDSAAALLDAYDDAGIALPMREIDPRWDEYDHTEVIDVYRPGYRADVAEETRRTGSREPLRAFQEIYEIASRQWTDGGHDQEYRESFPAFASRVNAALDDIADALGRDEQAVVVSSGGVIAWVLATLLDGGVDAWFPLQRVLANSSVSVVRVGRSGPMVWTFNEHAHLLRRPGLLTHR